MGEGLVEMKIVGDLGWRWVVGEVRWLLRSGSAGVWKWCIGGVWYRSRGIVGASVGSAI